MMVNLNCDIMTQRERFIGLYGAAPSTLPAPKFLNVADLKEFKKGKDEKAYIKNVKNAHKAELRKNYPNGVGRHLNIPQRELIVPVKQQF